MNFIKNLKLGSKITIGFGAVIVLLIFTAVTGYIGYNIISNDFSQYREMSANDVLAGKIQKSLLGSRLSFKSYIQTGDEKHHAAFDKQFAQMEEAIFVLKESLGDSSTKGLMEKIHEDARLYNNGFDKVIDFKVRRENTYDFLNQLGPNMEKALTELVDSVYKGKNADAVYRLGMARRHLILARLHAARFLENNDFAEVDKVNEDFKEFDRWVALSKSYITGTSDSAALDQVVYEKESYLSSIQEIASLIEQRNITIEYMDQLGPEIADNAERIKLALQNKQENYGPMVNRNIQILTSIIVIITMIALILSILITIRITRLVVDPVLTVTRTFKEISHGEANLAVRLQKTTEDELGQMAQYFNKFMESLQLIITNSQNQSWLKTGQA